MTKAAMKRIACLTGRTYRGTHIAPNETPPAEVQSHALLVEAGARRGLSLELRYWDDAEIAREGFDCALIRSTWDYHTRPEVFLETLAGLERAGLRVFNSAANVRWNFRKTYLRELGDAAIQTCWSERIGADEIERAFAALGAEEIVVKPQVGAGSIDTVRLHRDDWRSVDLSSAPKGAAMIQPFLRAIETEGEWSLFWFGGVFSHAIRKLPKAGSWYANLPGTEFMAATPSALVMENAERARAKAPQDLLYVRIDLVLGNDGAWRVIEIEAIEPYLFFDFAPEGADVFAGALSTVLSG